MSADLFAEFNNLSEPAPEFTPGQSSNLPTAQAQNSGWSPDPFILGQGRGNHPSIPPPFSNRGISLSRPSDSGTRATFSQPARSLHHATADDDDGWGDFEVADSAPPSTFSHDHLPPGHKPQQVVLSKEVSSAAAANPTSQDRVFHVDQSRLSASGWPAPSWSQARMRSRTHLRPSDPSVLFDANDFELSGAEAEVEAEDDEGDDFGDFATALQPRLQTVAASDLDPAPSVDLLGLEDALPPYAQDSVAGLGKPSGALGFGASSSHAQPFVPKRDFFSNHSDNSSAKSGSDAKDTGVAGTSAAAADGVQTTNDGDDEWGAWDDLPAADTRTGPAIGALRSPDNWNWDVVDSVKAAAMGPSDASPPPGNVPPPSVILSAFPDLLNSGSLLLQPIAGQNKAVKEQVLSDPKAVQFLQSYALLGATAARVIAGRKHRWHRDKMLAKSMSISAAGSKGMKLAGVDKTQSIREDRESADVVAAWRENVGRLRAAVATANATGKGNIKVPELSESMQIRTAKMVPTARGPCLVCGLKRDERVSRVDLDVEDSFGEWWIEHWGHRACKNFWLQHEQRLRQR